LESKIYEDNIFNLSGANFTYNRSKFTNFGLNPVQAPTYRNELAANPKDTEKINNIKKLLEITGASNLTQQILTYLLKC
jgi:hypothetical protein